MPRFFFDVRKDRAIIADEEGSDFKDSYTAAHAAARSAAEIGTGRLSRGDISDVVFEVRDESGQSICTVTASMIITWHTSPYQGPDAWSV
jgi:hypothetical protein